MVGLVRVHADVRRWKREAQQGVRERVRRRSGLPGRGARGAGLQRPRLRHLVRVVGVERVLPDVRTIHDEKEEDLLERGDRAEWVHGRRS